MSKFTNIILNKNMLAPKFSWQTSAVGSKLNQFCDTVKEVFHPNKLGNEFQKVMYSNPDKQAVSQICDKFEKETGIKMLMTTTEDARCFNDFAKVIMRDIKKGKFPKDLKYVIFGHGEGMSFVKSGKDKWHIAGKPDEGIFDFIKNNIPKGEKVLVNCCETTPKQYSHLIPKDKPAIGKTVYTDASSSYYHPLKIVQSGNDKIIGGYANGIMTLY